MARIDYCLIRHGEQFGPDTGHESLVVAVGKIGAAVAALKNNVACKDALLLLVPENNASGRVSRDMQHMQDGIAQFYSITFIKHVPGSMGFT